MMVPLAESCDTNDVIPSDMIGKLIYAFKYLGPVTVVIGVVLGMGTLIIIDLHKERIEHANGSREQTSLVVEALVNSTHAMEEIAETTNQFAKAIQENTTQIKENGKTLERVLDRLEQ